MTRLISVPLNDGTSVVIEEADPGGVVRAGRPGVVVEELKETLESSLGGITRATSAVLSKVRETDDAIEGIEVELGVKLAAQVGVVIASGMTEANFKVTIRWSRREMERRRAEP